LKAQSGHEVLIPFNRQVGLQKCFGIPPALQWYQLDSNEDKKKTQNTVAGYVTDTMNSIKYAMYQ
jgi:hypothetical protein